MPAYVLFGAYGGIGSELTRRLTAKKSNVVIAGRNPEKLESLSNETGATIYPVDVTVEEQVDECIKSATKQYGVIDGIVNCAGSLLIKPAHLTTGT